MQRLYYSADEAKPSTFLQQFIVGEKIYVQRIQIVLGLLYTFTLVPPAHPEVEHRFTVTRDRSKHYHMYQHTHNVHTSTEVLQWSGLKSFERTCTNSCAQHYEKSSGQSSWQSWGQSTRQSCGDGCSHTLSVATYNIWNLNNIPGELYEDRLKRLGKVSRSRMSIDMSSTLRIFVHV